MTRTRKEQAKHGLITIIALVSLIALGIQAKAFPYVEETEPIQEVEASDNIRVYNFHRVTQGETSEDTSELITEPDNPKDYIIYKFKEHADKAFLLLQGDECHENPTLDPLAVNDNAEWGGVGRDRGIFQISDYWHPSVTDKMAFNWKENIDYAYRMFVNDNYTFTRWTCGDYYGI